MSRKQLTSNEKPMFWNRTNWLGPQGQESYLGKESETVPNEGLDIRDLVLKQGQGMQVPMHTTMYYNDDIEQGIDLEKVAGMDLVDIDEVRMVNSAHQEYLRDVLRKEQERINDLANRNPNDDQTTKGKEEPKEQDVS